MSTKYIKTYRNQKTSPTHGKRKPLHDLERLAAEIDVICRRRLPDGKINNGNLAGREPEIRQQALIKVVGGFLQRNDEYVKAVKSNDKVVIAEAQEKCTAIKLHHAKMQIATEVSLTTSRYVLLDHKNGGLCQHPSDLDSSDWPINANVGVLIDSVHRAVREKQLSVGNATIVDLLCNEDLSVAQAASRLAITPEAIYQQLKRVKGVLPKVMEYIEVRWVTYSDSQSRRASRNRRSGTG